jgi:hypothetical protein
VDCHLGRPGLITGKLRWEFNPATDFTEVAAKTGAKMKKVLTASFVIALLAAVPALAGYHSESGYLADVNDYGEFVVYANSDYIEITFEWPVGADFWVTVYGMYDDLLGDFQLAEGEIIQLSGGGKFTLIVTSEYGGGEWSCWWDD